MGNLCEQADNIYGLLAALRGRERHDVRFVERPDELALLYAAWPAGPGREAIRHAARGLWEWTRSVWAEAEQTLGVLDIPQIKQALLKYCHVQFDHAVGLSTTSRTAPAAPSAPALAAAEHWCELVASFAILARAFPREHRTVALRSATSHTRRIPMQAYELTIDTKVKSNLFDIVSADDFQVQPRRSIDPRVVLEQPTVSLYCLDHANQQALFVDTAPEVDLLQAPFYFIAQYEAAQRLIAVPYATLHVLAGAVELDPQRIILFYSTGRCGSTLFSHILNQTPNVVSFSEPDVFTQLVKLRTAGQSNDAGITALLYDALMIMSAHAQQHGFQYWAFKFRSYVLSVSDLLYQAVPAAKLLFLYRNALTWARSFSRVFGSSDAALEDRMEKYGYRYVIPSIDAHLRTQTHPMSWIEYLAHMWVSTMQDSRSLQQQGAALACARFEDLQVAPQAVIQALLAHCGLPMPDSARLARVLAEDSQSGTAGAQDRQVPVRRLTEADLAELDRIIRQYDPTLAPDTTLPQTVRP
jgi:hypothetical protein